MLLQCPDRDLFVSMNRSNNGQDLVAQDMQGIETKN